MLKIGIIGFGKMGQLRAETLTAIENCEVVAIYDPVLPENLDYPVAGSIDEIIENQEIGAVVISVPNFIVKQTTIAALRNGKHVFCEKPPAMDYADVKEISEVHRETGLTLMYGFNHRRHAAVMKMRELATEGTLGRVLWMRGRYGKSVDAEYLRGWRAKKELAGGGILLDQGIHMLDLFLYVGGQKFDEVQAMVSNLYWKTDGIEDNVFAAMRNTKTGMCAQLHSTMTQWRHLFSLEVFCEKGYMVLNGLKTGSGTYGDEVLTVARNRSKAPAATWQDEEKFSYPVDESWSREAVEFVDVVEHGKVQTHGTIKDAMDVMELIDTIYKNDHHIVSERFEDLQ
ncbi:Gfo/Idh/MocA family protein [Phaeobacter gallaeciensis]|uniref:Gfo/Idh/MocA family protein n=1 Tax=Phaeobacter gallaeciensis TaxID=60890 RepID=UPI00237F2221|nr:Gfo/Idh/MocA family oxidoreductase [Phaeobacter gallaeciensis]MDE4193116.1 Gfo/Idh/MocA family oxidoreductase [Phaeobacter gallaeciensis]MDE4201443.1 Gfo/Idh/MocA family oxidoreductase [Phaeobacter gallaeciensis]MDE4205623.1 Gfo/Idh/MocA family oxidoreductase [Phaeobacter gallaeciensis]MDE4209739.1 Gfo/Idh/MocA family oxidoreductase [Phaeobacter gallaeciensis]MDE4218161.1 Gfo/Idh/MocA family oxidoreductase [Phaeobacter gallaeciensis]